MSKIAYDPVKDRFADIIRRSDLFRTLFYRLLDMFFLRSWYIRALLNKYGSVFDLKNSWHLLDAGCGFGQYDRYILNEFDNVEVTAVDVKNEYLRDCRTYFSRQIAEGRIGFAEQNLLELDVKEQYDMALCVDVLEHITEDHKVIKNLYRSLKPSGYIIMHSPSHYSESDAGEDDSFVNEHARAGYSKHEITQKMKDSGFEPVDVSYTYGEKGHAAWVLLIKYPMLLMNRIKLFALPFLLIYYLLTLPVGLILMRMDMSKRNEKGTGIYAVARKPSE